MLPHLTVLLIIKNALVMESVSNAINSYFNVVDVIGKCYTLSEGNEAKEGLKPDIVILDLDYFEEIEFEQLKQMTFQDCRLIVLISNKGSFKRVKSLDWDALVMKNSFS